MQISRSATQSAEADSIDEETRRAIARFKFSYPVEQQFRDAYLERNLPHARIATGIFLTLMLALTAISLLGGMPSFTEAELQPIYLLRIGLACPALVLILAATYLPSLQPSYQWLAGSAAIIVGLSVTTISVIAAKAGHPQFQMSVVLAMVYATLFLGLLFRVVVGVAACFLLAFVAMSVLLDVSFQDLSAATAALVATALMAVLSTGRAERLVRTAFIEAALLSNIAERDGLSGLYNRRMFDTLTRRLWKQAQQSHASLQIVLVDIDHFKRFNDRYGHQAGDDCIRQVANIIAHAAQGPLDFCARYGGEEFALVVYAASDADAQALPEQIRREIMARAIPHADSNAAGVITVSLGSAIAQPGTKRSLAGLIQAADEALYRAKQTGRNRVVHVDSGNSEAPTGAFKVFAVN